MTLIIIAVALVSGAIGYVIGHSAGYSECRDFLKKRRPHILSPRVPKSNFQPHTFGVTHEEKEEKVSDGQDA